MSLDDVLPVLMHECHSKKNYNYVFVELGIMINRNCATLGYFDVVAPSLSYEHSGFHLINHSPLASQPEPLLTL